MKTWFTITNRMSAEAAQIDILDDIGEYGVTAKDFAAGLKAIPATREIVVSINSRGGSVFEGWAIYSMLAERRERVTCKVIGLAASMASVVMLAGRRVVASEFAQIMIHNPAAAASGTSKDMRETADLLDKLSVPLANVYATKSGKSPAMVAAAMNAETWFTAAEAKAWGLVDDVEAAMRVAASFDLSRFNRPPRALAGSTEARWAKQFERQATAADSGRSPARTNTAAIWAEQLRKKYPSLAAS